jgi:hypothetical protein
MFGMFLKAQKGSGATEGLLNREGEHFLGWDRLWEMRGCRIVVVVGTLN